MYALQLISGDRELGTVVLKDQRDDGSVVVLICEEHGGAQGGGAGVVGVPAPPDDSGDSENWVYPMKRAAETAATQTDASAKFNLTLDLTEMPRGPLEFEIDRFTEQASMAAHRGEDVVLLDEHRAEEWGFRRRQHVSAY